jgi:hypothetical protein
MSMNKKTKSFFKRWAMYPIRSIGYRLNGYVYHRAITDGPIAPNRFPIWRQEELEPIGPFPDGYVYYGAYTPGSLGGFSLTKNTTYIARYEIDVGALEYGKEYTLGIASLYGAINEDSNNNGNYGFRAGVKIYVDNQLEHDYVFIDIQANALESTLFQLFIDELTYTFDGQSGYTTMQFDLEFPIAGSGAATSRPNSWGWVGFKNMRLVEGPSDEELWQDEQRSFWDKVIAFFESISEFFRNLIESIQNFFDEVKAFFAQLGEMIKMIFHWIGERCADERAGRRGEGAPCALALDRAAAAW